MTPASPLIQLHDVAVEYRIRHGLSSSRRYQALQNVSMDVLEGETLGLIGRNGAGKSTLLRILAGIIRPDRGRMIQARPLTVSVLTLQLGFSQELSGRDNALLGIMFLGYSKREAKERIEKVAAFSELEDWMDEPLHTYSSGMKTRLGFAVAMEACPDVLLVDEVLGVGDQRFREKSAAALKQKMRSGQTTVFVSHQLQMLAELCSRTVWIEQGTTWMLGQTEKVLAEYEQWNRSSTAAGLSGGHGWVV